MKAASLLLILTILPPDLFVFLLVFLSFILLTIFLGLVMRNRSRRLKKPPSEKKEATNGTPAIFISYRRDDTSDVTGRIYDRLIQHFGKDSVFKDVDSIPLGVDFKKHLRDSVARCDVLLTVIGRQWLIGYVGERRLDDVRDFV